MTKKIGWQTYEEMLIDQLSSPIASLLTANAMDFLPTDSEEEQTEKIDFNILESTDKDIVVVPVPESFHEQINLLTNYECRIGHTNFDITESIKSKIEKAEGVEILKICSRYRFFVGIGKMFNFKEVRKTIEELIL